MAELLGSDAEHALQRTACALGGWDEPIRDQSLTVFSPCSGIFGYVNYLVEKDRKFIVDTLINGMCPTLIQSIPSQLAARGGVALLGRAGM